MSILILIYHISLDHPQQVKSNVNPTVTPTFLGITGILTGKPAGMIHLEERMSRTWGVSLKFASFDEVFEKKIACEAFFRVDFCYVSMVFGEHGREQQVHVFIVVQVSVSPAWHLHSETLAKKCCKCLASPSLVLQRHFEVAFFNLHPQTAFGSLKSGDAFFKKIPDSQIGWESPNPLGFFSEKKNRIFVATKIPRSIQPSGKEEMFPAKL